MDGDLAMTFQTVTEQLSVFCIRERLLALLSGFFGALAIVLAAIGTCLMTSERPRNLRVARTSAPRLCAKGDRIDVRSIATRRNATSGVCTGCTNPYSLGP